MKFTGELKLQLVSIGIPPATLDRGIPSVLGESPREFLSQQKSTAPELCFRISTYAKFSGRLGYAPHQSKRGDESFIADAYTVKNLPGPRSFQHYCCILFLSPSVFWDFRTQSRKQLRENPYV